MKVFKHDKTRIRIYSGSNTIGGNCIVIESPSMKIMFDQGVNFIQLRKFYGFSIWPDSVEELREMKVLPPKDAYEDVEEIYISHLHLDHLGSLNIPKNIPLYLPSKEIAELLSRSWWFGWKQQLLPESLSFYSFRNVEEGNIRCARVSHSAFPSYAFRIDTGDTSIIYTGDLRLTSPHHIFNNSKESLSELAEDGVDILIVEGTNFGRRMDYLTPPEFKHLLDNLLEKYNRNLLFISTHPLDLETTLATFEIVWKRGYIVVFTNNFYAQLIDATLNNINYEVENGLLYTPISSTKVRPLDNFELESSLSSLKDKKIVFFIPATNIKDVGTITRLLGEDSRGLIHITILGEPTNEEWLIERKKIENWLRILGVTSYRIHLSGHYQPYEFKEILSVTKPEKIIPVHTTAPKTMKELFEKYRSS